MARSLGTLGFVIVAVLLATPVKADPIAVGDIVQVQTTESDGVTPLAGFNGGGPFRMDLAGMVADIVVVVVRIPVRDQQPVLIGEVLHEVGPIGEAE